MGRDGEILTSVADRVARVTINRPERRNAVDVVAMDALGQAIEEASHRADVGCVVLAGAQGFFCAGADLPDGELAGPESDALMMEALARTTTAVLRAPVPVIAQVELGAAGVGASIVFAADLAVASTEAFFLQPFAGIGLVPDGGATATVAAAMGRARAMRLALLGERLSATDAVDAGLIAFAVAPDEVAATVDSLAARLAAGATDALARTKSLINACTLGDMDAVLDAETQVQLPLLSAPAYAEGVAAFRERRPAVFRPAD